MTNKIERQQISVAELEDRSFELKEKLLNLCGTYSGSVHIGGDLSVADILTALFQYGMRIDPSDIANPSRDRFVLSKGHAAVCMYIAMAIRGFFDYDEIVRTYGQLDSAYGMHPCKVQLPGVEASTGSLGHGLPIAVGMALHGKHAGADHRVFTVMGDGETGEGSVWEAAIVGRSQGLGNLVAFIDRNHQLMTSMSEERIVLEPYADKWRAFGWNVMEIDGHDMNALVDALDSLPAPGTNVPTAVVCHTVKGNRRSRWRRHHPVHPRRDRGAGHPGSPRGRKGRHLGTGRGHVHVEAHRRGAHPPVRRRDEEVRSPGGPPQDERACPGDLQRSRRRDDPPRLVPPAWHSAGVRRLW